MVGFSFHEIMEGALQREGERFDRPFRFDLDVRFPSVLAVARTAVGRCTGTVTLDGLAKDAPAEGTLEMSPIRGRRLRYELSFAGHRFEGVKTLSNLHPVRSWTTLPGTVWSPDGSVYGQAVLRFVLRRHTRGLLQSFRVAAS